MGADEQRRLTYRHILLRNQLLRHGVAVFLKVLNRAGVQGRLGGLERDFRDIVVPADGVSFLPYLLAIFLVISSIFFG